MRWCVFAAGWRSLLLVVGTCCVVLLLFVVCRVLFGGGVRCVLFAACSLSSVWLGACWSSCVICCLLRLFVVFCWSSCVVW